MASQCRIAEPALLCRFVSSRLSLAGRHASSVRSSSAASQTSSWHVWAAAQMQSVSLYTLFCYTACPGCHCENAKCMGAVAPVTYIKCDLSDLQASSMSL